MGKQVAPVEKKDGEAQIKVSLSIWDPGMSEHPSDSPLIEKGQGGEGDIMKTYLTHLDWIGLDWIGKG